MAAKAGRLQVQMELDIQQLRRDLEKTNAELKKASKGWSSSVKEFGMGFADAFRFDAVRRGIDAFVNSVTAVMGKFDEVADGAKKIGVSAEAFQELSYAATQSGASVDDVVSAVARMNKGMGEAASGGGKKFVEGLGMLGLELKDLKGLSPDKQFIKIMDAMSKTGDVAKRQAGAAAVFGKGVTALGALATEGADGINKMIDSAHRLGIIMSDEAVKAGEEFNDRLDTLKLMTMGLIAEGLQPLLTTLNEMMGGFQDTGKSAKDAGDDVYTLLEAAKDLGMFLSDLLRALQLVMTGFAGIGKLAALAFTSAVEQAKNAAEAIGNLNWNPFDPNQADDNAKVWGDMWGKMLATERAASAEAIGIIQKTDDAMKKMEAGLKNQFRFVTSKVLTYPDTTGGGGGGTGDTDKDTEATKKNAEAKKAQAEALRAAEKAAQDWVDEMATIADLELDIAQAQRELSGETQEQAQAWRDSQVAMTANQTIIADLTKDSEDLKDAVSRQRQAQEDLTKAQAEYNAEVMRAQGVPEAQVQAYLDQAYGLSKVEIELRKTTQATDELASKRQLANDQARELAETLANGVADVMGSMVESTDSAVEALKRLVIQLTATIVTAQILAAMGYGPNGGGGQTVGGLGGGGLFGARGLAFNTQGLEPFRQGGVVFSATPFTFGGGRKGVMGEAGPEAIMPLRRGAGGRLGVSGSAPSVQVFNYGARVDVQREGDQLKVIVDQVRAGLASDIARGGNPLSTALERSYGVRR